MRRKTIMISQRREDVLWHMNCIGGGRMANRMNMLKLLQEMRGLHDMATRHFSNRQPVGLMSIPIRRMRGMPPKKKRVIPISMQDSLDFPSPVKITYLSQSPEVNCVNTQP